MTFKKLVVEDYIGDVNKNMAPSLKSEDPTQLQTTYNIAGNLCKYCSPLLYVQVLPPIFFTLETVDMQLVIMMIVLLTIIECNTDEYIYGMYFVHLNSYPNSELCFWSFCLAFAHLAQL